MIKRIVTKGITGRPSSASVLAGLTALFLFPHATARGQAPAPPKFEVASIKACKGGDAVPGSTGPRGGRAGSGTPSPDRLDLPCLPVRFFIQLAYIIPNAAQPNSGALNLRLEGGPSWIDSERYQIQAKADGPQSRDMMTGPMLQALLEDRFQLKVHRDTREVPLYALTLAKSGLKLQPSDGGNCTPRDPAQTTLPPPAPGQKPWCGLLRRAVTSHAIRIDLLGASMTQFSQGLGGDRPVIDRTGIKDRFDFHVEFAPESADPSDDLAAPSIFFALGQLGLKLEAAKGPREFLVIDHVEKPSEN